MKKILGFTFLVLCAFLMSCSNPFSDKTGNISFSFSAEDAIQAANSYAARADAGTDDQGQTQITYTFLAQIKGSRGYYESQMKSVTITNTPSQNTNQVGSLGSLTVVTPYGTSSQYITENTVDFNFNRVPSNQKYKVMFDMFVQESADYPAYLVLSGHSQDIQVLPGLPADVTVDLDDFEYSPISMVIEFEDDSTITIGNNLRAIANPTGNQWPEQQTTYGQPIYKKYGKLWYYINELEGYKPVKNIYYKLDPDSNFVDSDYRYSVPCGFQEGNEFIVKNYITFDGSSYSLYDFLDNYKFPEKIVARDQTSTSDTLEINSPATITKTGSNGNFSFVEKAPNYDFKSNDEVASGSRTGVRFPFTKYTDTDTGVNDFVANASIYGLLGLNSNNFALSNKTIVLVLNMKGNNPNPNNTQLYYKLDQQEDSVSWTANNNFSDGDLRNENYCINLKPGETKFIIPFNYSEDTPNLTLFMDANGNGANSLIYTFDVDYYVFPDDMSPFIFNIKYNDNRYRYELDEYFNRHVSSGIVLSDGDNLKNKISGVFCLFSLKDKKFIPISTQLTSELWYWDSSKPSDQYTTISQTPQTFTTDTDFAFDNNEIVSRPHYDVNFSNIQNTSTECDKKVLIHADCQDTNYLLVIRDFNMTITKVNQ